MPDERIQYSEAIRDAEAASLDGSDVFAIAQEDAGSETGYVSRATKLLAIANKVVKGLNYSSDLQTTNKTVIGAINEVNTKASQFDNMTATASGSIATFDNGGDDIPVSEFECEIVAQQASGTPTPVSPLPITGHSESDIPVCGKNLLDSSIKSTNVQYCVFGGVLGSNIPNGSLIAPKGNIVFKSSSEMSTIEVYDQTGTLITSVSNSDTITFNNPNAQSILFTLRNYGADWNSITYQLETGTIASEHEPYTGNLYTVAFGQTIYGGRLIYANGQWSIEATQELATFDGSADENWEAFGSKGFTINLLTMQTVNQYENGLVNYLPFTTSSSEFGILIGSNNKTIYCMQMVGNLTGVTDLASWKTYLSNNNLEFTYPLTTPVIIPLTSSTRVKTISGDNNIFSNTGDCELKYFTNKADSLAELVKAFVV